MNDNWQVFLIIPTNYTLIDARDNTYTHDTHTYIHTHTCIHMHTHRSHTHIIYVHNFIFIEGLSFSAKKVPSVFSHNFRDLILFSQKKKSYYIHIIIIIIIIKSSSLILFRHLYEFFPFYQGTETAPRVRKDLMYISPCYRANTGEFICRNLLNKVTYEFVLPSLAVLSKSCSSHSDSLWDGK